MPALSNARREQLRHWAAEQRTKVDAVYELVRGELEKIHAGKRVAISVKTGRWCLKEDPKFEEFRDSLPKGDHFHMRLIMPDAVTAAIRTAINAECKGWKYNPNRVRLVDDHAFVEIFWGPHKRNICVSVSEAKIHRPQSL